MIVPRERLHDADARKVLLHDAVDAVEPLLHLLEQRERAPKNDADRDHDDRDQDDEEQRETRRGRDAEREAAHEQQRRADHDPEQHLHRVGELGNVRRQPRDEAAGLEPVEVGERQRLDLAEERGAEIRAETLRGADGEDAAKDTRDHADDGQQKHQPASTKHLVKVVVGDALIDDPLGQARLHEVHTDLDRHHDRREDDEKPVFQEKRREAACGSHGWKTPC